mmetsp:Transcript_108864/g.289530  ORF Transcript_108864/g.289530 Transcript_108864/m.289530 type:complete len:209 (-) Transcript_108864:58-684(-)
MSFRSMLALVCALSLAGSSAGVLDSKDSTGGAPDFVEEFLRDDSDSQMSLLQVDQSVLARGAGHGGGWFMSPLISELCNASYETTPMGIIAPPNPCKKCADNMDKEMDLKYVTMLADVPRRMVNLCEDGALDGCRDCGLLSWVTDHWLNKMASCCHTAGADAVCSRKVQDKLAHVQGQKRIASCGNSTTGPPPGSFVQVVAAVGEAMR